MAAELFVSYARKDRDQVIAWIQRLQAGGASVWIDEAGIDGARLWGKEIVEAIDACKVLVLMLSPASAASSQVVREVSLALDGDKHILPLLLEPVEIPSDLRFALAGIHHIELFAGDSEEKLRAIVRALTRLGVNAKEPEAPEQAAEQKSVPHNLPRQLTRFIGREKEMADVKRLLANACLLTLVGAGGCGKTRLATEVAGGLLEQYADGVWLVEFAALAEPSLVAQAVASALGIREEPGRPLIQTLTDYLRPKSLLLVLDNCEHLVAACAQLADALLRGCPQLRVLATSREALGVPGEATWRVPSLALPDPQRLPPVESFTQYEAVELFIDRALLSQPSFAVTDENAPAVAQICWQLDGIPLAIELAAARVKVLSVEQIAARLDDRFRLLTAGSRTLLPRQQTLRALIDWSYDLLSEAERALFRRLSVFAGGWTLAAAEAVCSGEGIEEYEVLDLLGQLVDKSLVMEEEQRAEARYRFLESIRQYGAERLRASSEAAATHDRHGEFYLTLAEQAELHLTGAEQATWLDRLEKEHVNLRAALGWMIEKGDAESGLRLGAALWRFWHVRGYLREGRARLATVLALPGAATCASGRARALNGAGALAHDQGDFEQAEALHRESRAIAQECGDKESIAVALNNLGNVALDQGSAAEAATFYQEALALWRELGNMRGIAMLLNNLGNVARDRGDYEEAAAFFRQSLALQRELGNQRGIATSLNNMGNLAISQGSYESAAALLDESLRGYQALGDSYGIAMALDNLACLALRQGSLKQAGALYRECLSACAELESKPAIAGCLEGLAGVMAARGHPLQAARLYGAAEALREAAGAPLPDSERLGYDRAIATARIGIAEIVWETAWQEGRGMSVPQAMAAAAGDGSVSPSARPRSSTQGPDEGLRAGAGGADQGATTSMQPVNAAPSLPLVT